MTQAIIRAIFVVVVISLISMGFGGCISGIVANDPVPPMYYLIDGEWVTTIPEIPSDYYSSQQNISDIHLYLKTFEWRDDQQYERNKFDCSNMAAWMERHLEQHGCNVQIRHTITHAWIMVEVESGDWIAYECTECAWKSLDDPRYFIGKNSEYYCDNFLTFDNIYDIRDTYTNTTTGQYLFNREWAT